MQRDVTFNVAAMQCDKTFRLCFDCFSFSVDEGSLLKHNTHIIDAMNEFK
jgi:hypothetical protein